MADWIFRGNREDFEIDTYLRNFDYIYWAVKHQKHQSEMQVGDRVFIWRSKGKSKDPYGIVAYGEIIEAPVNKREVRHPEFLLEEYWDKREVSEIKVGIKIKETRLDIEKGLVESGLLLRDNELSKMQLLTARQGTNFRLSINEFSKIWSLWRGETLDLEDDEYATDESKTRLRTHKVRERDSLLVKKAKERFIKEHGALFCEVCGYDFLPKYGFSYAEAHHKKPLSKIKAGEKTKESDLAIVCANCHRAVHRIESDDPWSDLLNIHGKL
ncbi:hypothetical protein GCM10010919_33270 [Alishewanella longhuensis]|uniref:EVE domain-containing protein n=1 Tax=Alishewanella longhuensis TaxID=1091037 RepID=A0ABQ3LB05_9ALTE|nr:EVE domain-containing protein [Alishewanella longhuensis]GHG77532.1 hypothetical protein GCM10010919_33270 [Alishewanella longhuensis]